MNKSATVGGVSNNTGPKVAGGDIKIEPKKYLYFVFYTSVGSKNDEKFKNAAKKRYDAIVGEINKKKDAKNHLAFLVKANSKDAMTNYVRQKVEVNGGKKKAFIAILEATTELNDKNSLYSRVKQYIKSIKTDTDQYQPTPYFSGNIDTTTINSYNQNIMRNEAHNKFIMSPEHQKKVYKMVADDCDNASTKLGWIGAGLIASANRVPGGLKVITLATGGVLMAASGIFGGGKLVFKYLADDLKAEELVTEVILAKTVYVKNELAEYAYDQAFSKMAEFFYKE